MDHGLDPDDWDVFSRQCHRILDDMLAHQRDVRQRPVWRPLPDEARQTIRQPPQAGGEPLDTVYEQFRSAILPYPLGNDHPRHWGWVSGTGTPLGAMADFMAAAMNTNCWGAHHAPNAVEAAVVDWLKAVMGFPESAAGILVSGASEANLHGLSAARTAKGPPGLRKTGLDFSQHARPLVYMSEAAHHSSIKAIEILGLGSDWIRRIPANGEVMDTAALAQAIAADKADGLHPAIVVGTIGTVATGAIDPLSKIADICAEHDLWFHLDGAFGALVKLAPDHCHLADGLERADSLAFDLHKWAYQPYDIAVSLVRDRDAVERTFAGAAGYLMTFEGGIHRPEVNFANQGFALSRGFRALKAWFALKVHGPDGLGRAIGANIEQARHLASLVRARPQLELVTDGPLNVVTFRHVGDGGYNLDLLNERILVALQERGVAAPSNVVVDGKFVLRCAIANHRTRLDDLDALVEAVCDLGREFTD